jgi:isopenicillin N synthase-like dioxygenase
MQMPVIDLDDYTPGSILEQLHTTGCVIVKVPNTTKHVNNRFIDMLEEYSELPPNIQSTHVRKELHYQVGLTPSNIETPLDHCEKIHRMGGSKPTGSDPKMRWFHRVTDISPDSQFTDTTGSNVIPAEFPEWEENFTEFGDTFLDIVENVSTVLGDEIVELGDNNDNNNQFWFLTYFMMLVILGMMYVFPDISFSFSLVGVVSIIMVNWDDDANNNSSNDLNALLYNGNHLIAPTIVRLEHLTQPIIAGFHSDISFFSVHGKSRFSGLNIWSRDDQKTRVSIPNGCVLIQAGRQLEYITNGYILAGFHEVVVEDDTRIQYARAKQLGKSTTRVSSTFFAHINSDKYMSVLPQFYSAGCEETYPSILEGDWLRQELQQTLTM